MSYAHFDGMTWPVADSRLDDAEWALRYGPNFGDGTIGRADLLFAASVLAAYRQMISDPATKRARVIRELRRAARAQGTGGGR